MSPEQFDVSQSMVIFTLEAPVRRPPANAGSMGIPRPLIMLIFGLASRGASSLGRGLSPSVGFLLLAKERQCQQGGVGEKD